MGDNCTKYGRSSQEPSHFPPGRVLEVNPGTARRSPTAPGETSDSLLYLNCNNSDNTPENPVQKLTSYHKKQSFVLSDNCRRFVNNIGINNIGFLTLTFPDNVHDPKEAQRRFNNMNRRLLSKFFGSWMLVKERQKRGAWHYHILIDCRGDIRTGINFEEINNGHYGSASARLRSLWQLLRKRLSAYGFGRSELLPIRSNDEAISKYVGKYISKHIGERKEEDKGVRLVAYSQNQVRSSVKLAWNSPGAKKWRKNLETFAHKTKCYNLQALKLTFGSSWAFHLFPYIEQVETLNQAEIDRIAQVYSQQHQTNFFPPDLIQLVEGFMVDLHHGQILF